MTQPIVKHFGRMVGGKFKFYNVLLWNQQLDQLAGKEFELIIKEKHQRPSKDTHGYYRGGILLTCASHEMFSHFDTPDAIHEDLFAPMFLSYYRMVKFGNEQYQQKKIRSLSTLNQKEMNEFITKVIAFCANEGITILGPEDYYLTYYKSVTKKKDEHI